MRDPMPHGSLRHVLLPQTFGRHQMRASVFTVLSVETRWRIPKPSGPEISRSSHPLWRRQPEV